MTHRFLKKKYILPAIAVLFVIGGSTAYLFPKLKIIIPLRLKYTRSASPRMYLVPQERTITDSTDKDGGFEYASGHLRFRIPLQAVQVFNSEHARAFVFEGSKSVIVSGQKDGDGVLNALLGEDPDQAEAMRQFWGRENLESEYAAVKVCLHATPDKGNLFSSRMELMRLPSMLLLKAVYSPLGDVIYQYETKRYRGFQFGNPQQSEAIFVYLFDTSDRLFRIKLSSLDQKEIDSLLASVTIAPRG
jgi:hypothetical protein